MNILDPFKGNTRNHTHPRKTKSVGKWLPNLKEIKKRIRKGEELFDYEKEFLIDQGIELKGLKLMESD